MSIKSRASSKEYNTNWDTTFKGKKVEPEEVEYWTCWRDEQKITAKFLTVEEAVKYATDYPRDAQGGIKNPKGVIIDINLASKLSKFPKLVKKY